MMSAAVFTFVLLIISAAIPKEENARYYDRFEELFMDTSNNNRLFSDYTYFSEFSGGADSFRGFSNRRMYTVYGPQDPYFKRQTFDYYDLRMTAGMRTIVIPSRIILIMSGRLRRESFPLLSFRKP